MVRRVSKKTNETDYTNRNISLVVYFFKYFPRTSFDL